ncbi:hypothetical protein AB4114_18455 [Paenibacillus sp. 2RAB27]|uniref:hypothetical protein n=1 Tax=Paenibacillus sp. 2RAB27 TaxID=3232991 RepID=UPI003F9AE458
MFNIYEPIISDLVKTLNNQDKPLDQRDTYGKAFFQIVNLCVKRYLPFNDIHHNSKKIQ